MAGGDVDPARRGLRGPDGSPSPTPTACVGGGGDVPPTGEDVDLAGEEWEGEMHLAYDGNIAGVDFACRGELDFRLTLAVTADGEVSGTGDVLSSPNECDSDIGPVTGGDYTGPFHVEGRRTDAAFELLMSDPGNCCPAWPSSGYLDWEVPITGPGRAEAEISGEQSFGQPWQGELSLTASLSSTSCQYGDERLASDTAWTVGMSASALTQNLIAALVLAPFFAVFVAFVVLRGRQERRRRARFVAFAKEHGLEYSTEDPFGLVDRDLALFRRGDERRCTNVLSGGWKGLRLRYADYEYWIRGQRSKTAYRSIVLLDLPIDVPHLSIRRENILTRVADAAGLPEIDFESGEFNDEYRVSSDDREFAHALIDARMMRWLLDEAKRCTFELRGSAVLVYYLIFTDPGDLGWLLDRAAGFRDHIPRVVWAQYGGEASER